MIFTAFFQPPLPALCAGALLSNLHCAQPGEAHGMALAPFAINETGATP